MKFKQQEEVIYLNEGFWYALTEGGYLKPEFLLEEPDASHVRQAINTLRLFELELYKQGIMEDC